MYSPKNIRGGIENLKERENALKRMKRDLISDAEELFSAAYKDSHRRQIKAFLERLNS